MGILPINFDSFFVKTHSRTLDLGLKSHQLLTMCKLVKVSFMST